QCGKCRDLGFGMILNFQTKMGMGMSEQLLSREYYCLGTQLPIMLVILLVLEWTFLESKVPICGDCLLSRPPLNADGPTDCSEDCRVLYLPQPRPSTTTFLPGRY
ncbi:hypothetical protein GALMADRAFT_81467, partial [Galerina marginata CBS 339.88]